MYRSLPLFAQAIVLCALASGASADCVGEKDACIRRCNAGEALEYDCVNACFDHAQECVEQASPANAEQVRTSEVGRCINVSYDPEMRHLFTFHNTCPEKIHINFICRTCGEQKESVMVLRPGQKKSTGETGQEVERKGGYSIAACRGGYMAVGMDGSDWEPDRRYRCQRIREYFGRENGYSPQNSLAVLRHR